MSEMDSIGKLIIFVPYPDQYREIKKLECPKWKKSYKWIFMKISVMLQFDYLYYERAPFKIATEAQRRQALVFMIKCICPPLVILELG